MFYRKLLRFLFFSCCLILLTTGFSFAQNKRNSRPADGQIEKDSTNDISKNESTKPVYFYEFSQPDFMVSKVLIEHNENGFGKITFQKRNYDQDFTEPIKLSEKTLEKLKMLWTELEFLNSDQVYQSEKRDYGHLGTVKLKMKKDSKERTSEFNWTENLNAKSLADEYQKVKTQYVWVFDMNVSRENQPLESPRIMKRFDSYLKRDEISDPDQLKPYLKEISDDERFPLITRNHATRILKRLENIKKDKTEKNPD